VWEVCFTLRSTLLPQLCDHHNSGGVFGPNHCPKIRHCMRQRSLSCNISPLFSIIALKTFILNFITLIYTSFNSILIECVGCDSVSPPLWKYNIFTFHIHFFNLQYNQWKQQNKQKIPCSFTTVVICDTSRFGHDKNLADETGTCACITYSIQTTKMEMVK
jgi:hypothetical protein